MSVHPAFADEMNEYRQKLGRAQPVTKLESDRNTVWLNQQYGTRLDAMPFVEQLELLMGQPLTHRWAKRLGPKAASDKLIRPEMLLALFRLHEIERKRATRPQKELLP